MFYVERRVKESSLRNSIKTRKDLIDHLKKKDFILENVVDHLMVHFGWNL